MSIPQMSRKLDELDAFFSLRTQQFAQRIQKHQGRFTHQDYDQFEVLLQSIKEDALHKINSFFLSRFETRSAVYETEVSSFQSDGDHIQGELQNFRKNLIQQTISMKEEQSRKEELMEHFSQKLRRNAIMKKCIKIWKDYQVNRKRQKALDEQMKRLYHKNLLKKSFFPWRTLTYKDGHANSIRKQAQLDIDGIHQQYQSIIGILKSKISQTEEVIGVKKAAKAEFAYALSKNMLKSISNLSMEVMNLNQMSLKDGEWADNSTEAFLQEVDSIIKEKIIKVKAYRKGLVMDGDGHELGQKKKKHITFA